MSDVYVNTNQICCVEDGELCAVISLTNGEEISVTEPIDVVLRFTRSGTGEFGDFIRLNKFNPTPIYSIGPTEDILFGDVEDNSNEIGE